MLNLLGEMGTDQMGIKRPLGRTGRVRGWRLGITLCAAALVMALAGASNASAAKTICVGNVDLGSCTGNTVADLTAAIAAATDISVNAIYLAGGQTYSTPTGADFQSKPVR